MTGMNHHSVEMSDDKVVLDFVVNCASMRVGCSPDQYSDKVYIARVNKSAQISAYFKDDCMHLWLDIVDGEDEANGRR